MICPNCDEHIVLEDYEDTTLFQCEHCDTWLELEIDEGTYLGARHTALRIADDQDLGEV
ncbi:hypothetical protein [Acinetobacter bereziniae]|uniref:hypothetical protein n=1 Tax=Acinetobacter bereziniae TaxID=106648 RepID=UPI000B1BC649|nr:hypothetical protein [Acinetobacter bereziniae]